MVHRGQGDDRHRPSTAPRSARARRRARRGSPTRRRPCRAARTPAAPPDSSPTGRCRGCRSGSRTGRRRRCARTAPPPTTASRRTRRARAGSRDRRRRRTSRRTDRRRWPRGWSPRLRFFPSARSCVSKTPARRENHRYGVRPAPGPAGAIRARAPPPRSPRASSPPTRCRDRAAAGRTGPARCSRRSPSTARPRWRLRVATSPATLPISVCASIRPSPVITAPAARMRSSNRSASSTNAAPGTSSPPQRRPQSAGQAARAAGHRLSARVARPGPGEL